MNLNHLKYFYDSSEQKSLQKAAKINHVTPGAISQAIIRLEEFFQKSLVHHSKNSFQLTEEGKLLHSLCPQLFTNVDLLTMAMQDGLDPLAGEIFFATQQSIASSILPPIVSKFQSKYPKIAVNFTLGRTANVKRFLEAGEVDFAISLDNVDVSAFKRTELFKGNFVYIANTKQKSLKEAGLLITWATAETTKLEKEFRTKTGEELPVRMRIDSWGVIKNMAIQGVGIGFVPDYILTKEERKYLVSYPQLPVIPYSVSFLSRKNFHLNQRSLVFQNFIKDHIKL